MRADAHHTRRCTWGHPPPQPPPTPVPDTAVAAVTGALTPPPQLTQVTLSPIGTTHEEFDLISMYFGEAEKLPFDRDGRIILPKKLITHAEIKKNIMFVGLGPTFQMWNPQSYEIKRTQMIKNAKEKKINPRLKPIPKGI